MNIVFNQEMACTHTKHAFCIYNSDSFFSRLLGAYWVIRSDSYRTVYCMYINRSHFTLISFKSFDLCRTLNRIFRGKKTVIVRRFGAGRIIKRHISKNDHFCNWYNAKWVRQYRSNLFDNIIVSIVQYRRRSISIFESQLCKLLSSATFFIVFFFA